jgi:YD repeat-containing protein
MADMPMRLSIALVTLLLIPCFGAGQVKEPDTSDRKAFVESVTAADPFQIETGIYFREYMDLYVADSIPISFKRTQRNQDPRSRSFGIGASTSYDMFIIGDVQRFSWVALVLADGSQVRYARVSPGTGFADAIFENLANPGMFPGSRITWNQHGGWTVALKDGQQFTIQGCNASSKTGQCAVTEIKNARGERLTVQRDSDGNILRITSPRGHYVSVEHDSQGRITRVDSNLHQWVVYGYDEKGCLVAVGNWRGDAQKFGYDQQFNMTFVHEKGPPSGREGPYNFSITNSFDEGNRLKTQKISTGKAYSVKYVTDANNRIRQGDVRGPTGLTRFFFNEAGYEIREEFVSATDASRWTLERTLDKNSNATVELVLHCQNKEVQLPLAMDGALIGAGDHREKYLGETCRRPGKSLEPQDKLSPGIEKTAEAANP